jgi:hypothetical protein
MPKFIDKLTEAQKQEFIGFLTDPTIKQTEIAQMYKIAPSYLSKIRAQLGLARKYTKRSLVAKSSSKIKSPVQTLREIELEIQHELQVQEAAKLKLEQLRAKRAELQIRFEGSREEIKVYGITPAPMVASAKEWLSWLNLEGAKKLREYITVTLKDSNHA